MVPQEPPEPCQSKGPIPGQHKSSCYIAWGFRQGVADCWAKEARVSTRDCYDMCLADLSNEGCQKCLARNRQIKWSCTLASMKIEQPCTSCIMSAHKFWDDNCAHLCYDVFKPGGDVA